MVDPTTSVEQANGQRSLEELRNGIRRRDEEILRLRDLLIQRDAELGAAKGRLKMIDQGSQRLADAIGRIPIPGSSRLLHGLIRLLKGSRA
jgi:hypothetical protein